MVSPSGVELKNAAFTLRFDPQRCGIMSLRKTGDTIGTNFLMDVADFPELNIADAKWFGHIVTSWRVNGGAWHRSHSALSADIRTVQVTDNNIRIQYEGTAQHPDGIREFNLDIEFILAKDNVIWKFRISNRSDNIIEFGDIGIPLLFNQYFRGNRTFKYEQNVLHHTCLAGHGSWIYCAKSNGDGPILMMMPSEGTALEYIHRERKQNIRSDQEKGSVFGEYSTFGQAWEGLVTAYIHGACESASHPGTAKLPATSLF